MTGAISHISSFHFFPLFLQQYLLLMTSQMVISQVLGVGVGVGVGWTGGSQWLLLVCHSCAILGHEGSILPLGNMQSSFRLLSHVPREILIISKTMTQLKSVLHCRFPAESLELCKAILL